MLSDVSTSSGASILQAHELFWRAFLGDRGFGVSFGHVISSSLLQVALASKIQATVASLGL